MFTQPFVETDGESSESWQIPTFYGRNLGPQAFNKPASASLGSVIDEESMLTINTAMPCRTARGGTEVTLGEAMQGPTPFDFNHPSIAQPQDVRLPQIFTRDNGNYPQKYADNPQTYYHTA